MLVKKDRIYIGKEVYQLGTGKLRAFSLNSKVRSSDENEAHDG